MTATLNTTLDHAYGFTYVMLDGRAIGYYYQRPNGPWFASGYGAPSRYEDYEHETESGVRTWIETHWQEAHHG